MTIIKILLIQIQNIHDPFKPNSYVPFKLKYFRLRSSDPRQWLRALKACLRE